LKVKYESHGAKQQPHTSEQPNKIVEQRARGDDHITSESSKRKFMMWKLTPRNVSSD
jgi:hypothetical protein